MNPWHRFKAALARTFGEDPRRQVRFVLPYSVSGVNLSADETLSLGAVWACIDVIARNIASCRWNIYRPVPGTNRRDLLDSDYKTWMLNTRPNPDMTAIGFREAMLFQAIPFGNAYAEIVRDRGGRVVQLWPLISERMYPRRDPKTWQMIYSYIQHDGSKVDFAPEQVLHFRGPGMWGLMGDNVVARAAKSLAVAAAQERFSASFFGQGANPSGVLEMAGKLSIEKHDQLKRDWEEKHKGPDNANKVLILESGMKWTSTSTDPQKSQLVEGRKFSVEEICRWFGVPPHKIQHLEHATFSNIEHSSIEFVRDALTPWATRLQQEVDFKLFDQTRAPWYCTEIDLRPLTRGDAQSRAQAAASFRQNGIKTANEIRAEEGLDDCGDDGDILLVQSNLTTVEKILEPPQPPALPGGAPTEDDSDTADLDLDPDVEPDADEEADSPDEPSEAVAVARRAVYAALGGALSRFHKKLHHRRQAFKKGDPDVESFKAHHLNVALDELAPFGELFVLAVGRRPTVDDLRRIDDVPEGVTVPLDAVFQRELPETV